MAPVMDMIRELVREVKNICSMYEGSIILVRCIRQDLKGAHILYGHDGQRAGQQDCHVHQSKCKAAPMCACLCVCAVVHMQLHVQLLSLCENVCAHACVRKCVCANVRAQANHRHTGLIQGHTHTHACTHFRIFTHVRMRSHTHTHTHTHTHACAHTHMLARAHPIRRAPTRSSTTPMATTSRPSRLTSRGPGSASAWCRAWRRHWA